MTSPWMGLILLLMATLVHGGENLTFNDVNALARKRAVQPYQPPEPIPRYLQEMSYEQFQNIRFDPEQSLWHQGKSPFQVMLMVPGLYFDHAVKINIIDAQGTHPFPFKKEMFSFSNPELEKRVPADLGYAGFKLTFPFFASGDQNQFLVFAGASYFRGVGKQNGWGISSRGIAVDTGLPTGEEFPSFVEFWLVRPAANATQMMLYGLLDGPSLSGAYQFTIQPGERTVVQVKAVLYPRTKINLLGIAPLTSMFYYGKNTARPTGEWRPQVHDSEGLLIQDGASKEWLWRPLINPTHLEMDYFSTTNVLGFGLLQRDTEFDHYGDLGARYDIRPSTWVKPDGNWQDGQVVLVQLPTRQETNDNIVAFWTPRAAPTPLQPYEIGYSLTFGGSDIADQTSGHTVATYVGDGNIIGGGQTPDAYRVIVDFAGAGLDKLSPHALVQSVVTGLDGTEVLESFVEFNPAKHQWRLSVLAQPGAKKALSLRAFLKQDEQALTETWTYRLPGSNDIVPDQD